MGQGSSAHHFCDTTFYSFRDNLSLNWLSCNNCRWCPLTPSKLPLFGQLMIWSCCLPITWKEVCFLPMLIAKASASHQLQPCFWGPAVPSFFVLNLLPPGPAHTAGSGEVCKSYFNQSHKVHLGFPSGSVVKNLPAKAGDAGSVPVLGISPGGGHSNPLQYSCLENPLERGAWQATVHRVTKT